MEDLKKTIFLSQPCKKLIGNIESEDSIHCLKAHNAISGRSFKVQSTKGLYKIRVYDDNRTAKRIGRYVLHYRSFMPPYIGRDRKFLVSDWIEGDTLSKETITSSDAYAIGELYGKSHEIAPLYYFKVSQGLLRKNVKRVRKAKKVSRRILRILELLEDFYVQDPYICIEQVYRITMHMVKLIPVLEGDMVLEYADATLSNFLRTAGGMYYVDEDGLQLDIKGLAIPEIFKSTPEVYHEKFLEGYRKHHESEYLTPEYLEALGYFYALMKYIYCLKRRGPDANRTSLFRRELLEAIA